MSTAKFWILYLTLASSKHSTGNIILENGLNDLAIYGVENSCDNRIELEKFLPKGFDKEEKLADSFLLEEWQKHNMQDVEEYESVVDQQ